MSESRVKRIARMEAYFDEARQAIDELNPEAAKFAAVQRKIKALEKYYTGGQWLKDFEADEAGKLPADLKRGVLSEDAVSDLLDDYKELCKELKKPRWVFFDLGSTLVDERDVYKSRCEYAISQLNIAPEEFLNKVYEMARICPTPIKAAADAYGASLPEWDNSLEKLYDGAKEVISGLYGKYKLGIIANQTPGTRERLEKWGIGQYFDVVVASAEAGCSKPDPKIFLMAMEEAGCEPSEAVMIGDRLDNDVAPAKKLGMKTIWVRQDYAVHHSVTDETKRPDRIVDSIREIGDPGDLWADRKE